MNLDQLELRHLLKNDEDFFRLCRLIMVTEMRGMRQVELVLDHWLFRNDPELAKIFHRIKRDEPSHCFPYQGWLRSHRKAEITWREFTSDIFVNYSIFLWKLPSLVLNPFLKRRVDYPAETHAPAIENNFNGRPKIVVSQTSLSQKIM